MQPLTTLQISLSRAALRLFECPKKSAPDKTTEEKKMSFTFPSDEWIRAYMAVVNESQAYREAAKTWEGDLYFVVDAGPGVPQDVYLYMDLWHGACREAFEATDSGAKAPEFVIRATLPTWRKVIEGKLDPIRGMMTRQLKLKGNLAKIMRAPKAATELVNCCTLVDTTWPE
jgi:putative sterol carrier protein